MWHGQPPFDFLCPLQIMASTGVGTISVWDVKAPKLRFLFKTLSASAAVARDPIGRASLPCLGLCGSGRAALFILVLPRRVHPRRRAGSRFRGWRGNSMPILCGKSCVPEWRYEFRVPGLGRARVGCRLGTDPCLQAVDIGQRWRALSDEQRGAFMER
jgi:hypothetical protein